MLTTLSEPEQSDCEWTELKMNKAAAEVENRNRVRVFKRCMMMLLERMLLVIRVTLLEECTSKFVAWVLLLASDAKWNLLLLLLSYFLYAVLNLSQYLHWYLTFFCSTGYFCITPGKFSSFSAVIP